MKTHSTSASLWMPITKISLVMVIAAGLAHAQAAPNDAASTQTGASQGDTATPAAKAPKAHRHQKEVTLAPVKPEHYPSNPLPPVPTPKQKP